MSDLREMPKQTPSYSAVVCIGTGFSGITLGAQLQRWYNVTDIQYFERHSTSAGTWWINTYPGCGCDVPSSLYSISFEQNPNWSRMMPPASEIRDYANGVAQKYNLVSKMKFRCDVERCDWRHDAKRWLLTIRNLETDTLFFHECQVLFSAAGQLVEPREIDIPGAETFSGAIFHSARWNNEVDLVGKDVVVIGNGCTATQIVPAILPNVKSLTQVVRTQHWIFPAFNLEYSSLVKWCFKFLPGAMAIQRFLIFTIAEMDLSLFYMNKFGAMARERKRKAVEKYMRETAPQKYHDLLIPDFDVGCKRRIFDCGYLACLHSPKVNITDAKPATICPEGIRTASGELIKADVIVLANGFKTNVFLDPLKVHGRDGVSLTEHWDKFGGPSAYNCSAMSGFPNFFLLLGPNAATGHTSALMASENMINYALRVIKPILQGNSNSVEVKYEAEKSYVYRLQAALRKRVWMAGCNSWYINEKSWNSMSYPWSQSHFWFRSLFPVRKDWVQTTTSLVSKPRMKSRYTVLLLLVVVELAWLTTKFLLSSSSSGVKDTVLATWQTVKNAVLA